MSDPRPTRRSESGVTVLMVALSMVALVGMAALSIDVASLYVARSEAQRAADAAALAGARMFVSSGYTSRPIGAFPVSALCQSGAAGLSAAVNKQAELAAQSNSVAGQPAEVTTIVCTLGNSQNPRVTVTVRRTNVPTFFVRAVAALVGSAAGASTVTASATAEAYNMSGQTAPVPIEITGVKPWAVANCDPSVVVGGGQGNPNCSTGGGNHNDYIVDPVDGRVKSTTFIGSAATLNRVLSGAGLLNMYGLVFPDTPAPVCPSRTGRCADSNIGSGNTYIDNIACASQRPFHCGEPIGYGQLITAESGSTFLSPTSIGGRCLIHATDDGFDQGQDVFSHSLPTTITGGDNNPDLALRDVVNISRSDSVVTLAIYDGSPLCTSTGNCLGQAKVLGFLQVAVERTTGGPQVPVVVLNAVGCNSDLVTTFPPAAGTTISGGGSSPIPVRLVQAP